MENDTNRARSAEQGAPRGGLLGNVRVLDLGQGVTPHAIRARSPETSHMPKKAFPFSISTRTSAASPST